jgi:hypothetical protein
MTLGDGLIIILTIAVWRRIYRLAFGYRRLPAMLNSEFDLYGLNHEDRMRELDKKLKTRWILPATLSFVAAICMPLNPWPYIDPDRIILPIVIITLFVITWWCVTRDAELASNGVYSIKRVFLGVLFLACLWHPAFIPPFLFLATTDLRAWEHHTQMALRLLLILFAAATLFCIGDIFSDLTDFPWPENGEVALLTLAILSISAHYFVPGVKKLKLGKRPWSWALNNQLHHLPRSAYAWGWLRFIPEKTFLKITSWIKPFNVPLQLFIVAFEILFAFSLYSKGLTLFVLISSAVFHTAYFLMVGALFWQAILINVTVARMITLAPPEVTEAVFSPLTGTAGLLFLVFGVLWMRLWKPLALGWWDTPFVNRLEWHVKGESGKRYGVYNDFFCPNDRAFGLCKKAFYMTKDKVLTKHLGETSSEPLAYTLIQAGDDLGLLPKIVETFGQNCYSPAIRAMNIQYLKEFFTHYNEGEPKQLVPRWLKAPGSEWYYWGRLPRFTGQEKVSELEVLFLREYVTDDQVVRLYEKPVLKIQL